MSLQASRGTKGCACVVIAPAGARLFDGMSLGDGDIDEELPYARAGYVVVAYDVSGPARQPGMGGDIEAAKAFVAADCGVADGRRAIDYALKTLKVDAKRVAVAGHSSAATLALSLAENDQRVKACLAYAPIIDVAARLGAKTAFMEGQVPGLSGQLVRFSPLGHPSGLTMPTLLFHADDDWNAAREPIVTFATAHPIVKLIQVPYGGHYKSMIREGIPAGLEFLKASGLGP